MPTIADLRRDHPRFSDLSDEEVVKAVSQDYPDIPPEQIAHDLGVQIQAPPLASRGLKGIAQDAGANLMSGLVSIPESAVGLADIATGGAAGKAVSDAGVDFKGAHQYWADKQTDQQKADDKAVQDAHGVVDITKAALTHPSTIATSVIQSLPSMVAGGLAGRAIMGLGPLARAAGASADVIAGAAGEGTMMAGQDAEQIRQETTDGRLTGTQAALAGTIGVLGGGLSLLGGKVAQKLGIHDVDTMIAAGKVNDTAAKGIVRRVLEGAASEGLLEELPQSVMEQVLQNQALGKPLDEGVDNAAVMGALSGGAMGAGANVRGHGHAQDQKDESAPGAHSVPLLAAPSITVGADGTARTADQRQAAREAAVDVPFREVGPLSRAAGAAAQGATAPSANVDPAKVSEAVDILTKDEAASRQTPADQLQAQVDAERRQAEAPPVDDLFPLPADDAQHDRDRAVYEDVMSQQAGAASNAAQAGAASNAGQAGQAAPTVTPGTVDEGAHQSHSSPLNDKTNTDAQVLGGNATLGHTKVGGLDISVENADGSTRTDKHNTPPKWATPMQGVHYGYFRGTVAADSTSGKKQGVDVFLRAGTPTDYAGPVYVVDQIHQDGSNGFDEHKVMLGFNNRAAAVQAYRRHYSQGWKLGRITEMPFDQFKGWLKNGDTTKPASPKGPMEATSAAATQQEGAAAPAAEGAVDAAPAGATGAAAAPAVEAHGKSPAALTEITPEHARKLLAGNTEKPGGIDPAKQIDAAEGNGKRLLFGDVPLSDIRANEEGDRYDGTVNADRAKEYAGRGGEFPPVVLVRSRKTGALNVLDGGHRVSAARMRGDTTIKAVVSEQRAPRIVTVNDHTVELTPEQASAWDAADAEAETERTRVRQTYERERGQAPTDNPDVGLRGPKDRHDAEMKRIGMELSAKRRRIAGALTAKEQAADAADAEKIKVGERVTVNGEHGTVTGMAFGKHKVQLDDGSTATVPRDQIARGAPPKAEAQAETHESRWTRMTEDLRRALVSQTVAKPKAVEKIPRQPWAELSPGWQSTLAKLMDKAPAAPKEKTDASKDTPPAADAGGKQDGANAGAHVPAGTQPAGHVAQGNGEEAAQGQGEGRADDTAVAEPAGAGPVGHAQGARDKSPVVQFGRAMRGLGLELDGADVRQWSVDLGSGHEVHATLSNDDKTITAYRIEGGKAVDEQTHPFGAEATRAVQELVKTAMRAPVVAPAAAPVPDAPKASGNTIFTDEAYAKAREVLRRKLGTLNSGIDPELLQAGITAAGYHIEKGARTFAAYAKAMLADMGESIRPYLKSWYMAVAFDPRAEHLAKDMNEPGFVAQFDVKDIEAPAAAKETTAAPAPAPAQAGTLVQHFVDQIRQGNIPEDNPALRRMVRDFTGEDPTPATMKAAQEQFEAALVQTARDIAAKKEGPRSTFAALLRIYQRQPNLNVRTSTSVENQAYSTPAPLAFLASRMAGITASDRVLEPTAGNGMLLMEVAPKNAIVNELNPDRAAALEAQGFTVTQDDAATHDWGTNAADVVITNPPFGSLHDEAGKTRKERIDGYKIGQIDHLIAARALEAMKADGKGVLILGANMRQGGQSEDDRIFLNWLYSHYNVDAHFEVDGKLYARQGASWPVRVIAINGRKADADKSLAPAVGSIERVDSWEGVYERYEQAVAARGAAERNPAPATGRADGQQAGAVGVSGPAGEQAPGDGGRGSRGRAPRAGNEPGTGTGAVGAGGAVQSGGMGQGDGAVGRDDQAAGADRLEPAGERASSGEGRRAGPADRGGDSGLAEAENQFQAKYVPRSARKDEGILIPVNMAQPLQEALDHLEDQVGDIDEFAARELGYKSTEELHNALMGLQVDSVASAIYQIKERGKALIIADQTGIGKGRQAASMIRWAVKAGKIPVFVTVKPALFTDMYVEDLRGIGADGMVKPFIMNVGEEVKDHDGSVLLSTSQGERKRAMARMVNGEMPDGHNAVFLTYSQINVANDQRNAIAGIAPNAVFILDESHNAGGDSSTGEFVKGVLDMGQGTVYLSATYAKRPDNMPLYFKTDMGEAVADDNTLMDAMAAGGLPLQTVVSNNLVKAGQMFRRERSYDGVEIRTTTATEHRAEHVKLSDAATSALRAIVAADRMFHEHFFKELEKQVKEEGAALQAMGGNQANRQVDRTQFSSVVHNFVRQMLLGLNAQAAADKAVEAIKAGKKPLIALENTMGSFLSEYAANNSLRPGDVLGDFSYRTVLSRALERSRYYIEKDAKGNKNKVYVPLDKLDAVTRSMYDQAQDVIDNLAIDIPVSPIDWMRQQITNAGHTVAEITGRDLRVDYTDPKKPRLEQVDQQEQDDKTATTRRFNGVKGAPLDSIILNVAGSTGISLHASEKFPDQRKRKMIVAQAAQDINIFMQMLGRIHRTGQVELPEYEILNPDLPATVRPTALLSAKMKSLNANTSSNTESATSVQAVDMLNKYGDDVVAQYLADNPELSRALGIEAPTAEDGKASEEDLARKATGRLALMPVAVQEQFYEEVGEQYRALMDYLNRTNQNELEPRTFDFDAKELKSETIFQGENPDSPFGQDATYGEYSVKAQGKAMTPEEINGQIKESLDGKTPADHVKALIDALAPAYRQFHAGLASTPQMQELADTNARRGMDFMREHMIGRYFRVDINGDTYNAVVTNLRNTHKKGGNPFSLSKIQVTIAVNGALRSVTVPATKFQSIEVSTLGANYRVEQLFKDTRADDREVAKIITGNLLGAYGELQGTRGTIISFTKQDGSTEQGILLPKQFQMAENTKGGYRLASGEDAVRFLHEADEQNIRQLGIATRDNTVRILPYGERGITMRVPKSKAKGGKFFLDKALREQLGDFYTVGQMMVANTRDPQAAARAIDLVMKKQAVYVLDSMKETAQVMFAHSIKFDKDGKPEVRQGGKPMFSQGAGTVSIPMSKRVADELTHKLDILKDEQDRISDIVEDRVADGDTRSESAIAADVRAQIEDLRSRLANHRGGAFNADHALLDVLEEEAQNMVEIGEDAVANDPEDTQAKTFLPMARKLLRDIEKARSAFRQDPGVQSKMPTNAQRISTLQATMDRITETWARSPDTVVLESVASAAAPREVRQEARRLIENGGSIPSGVFFQGRVYLFADRIANEEQAAEVLFHEVLGHMGLRGAFRGQLDGILRQIAAARPADINRIIQRNGFKPEDRMRAAEEFLAEMAQTTPQLGFVRRAVAAIRTFLRQFFPKMELSDDEIIRSYILPARAWIVAGDAKANVGAPVPVFSQRPGFTFDASESPLFKHRTASQVHVPAPEVAAAALNKDATARRILAKGAAPADGERVGVRLNINVLKSTGVAVNTIHRGNATDGFTRNRGFWNGEVINYEPVTTVKGAYFNVGQGAREKIAAGTDSKSPMASVDGQYVARAKHNFDGVEFRFNPKREHLFRDGLGRVLRYADEATVVGNSVFARGNIEYYGEEDMPARAGDTPTQGRLFEPGNDEGTPMFSQGTLGVNEPRDFWNAARGIVDELGSNPGQQLNWWQKTFGTPYDLAQRHPKTFGRVYDRVQTFLHDVSAYATEAADLAPRILPKLDSWRDAFKSPLRAEDAKAIQAPVFEGTLTWARDTNGKPVKAADLEKRYEALDAHKKASMLLGGGHITETDLHNLRRLPIETYEAAVNAQFERAFTQPGIVWKDEELRSMFKLTEDQIGLYREARAAIDKSLQNLVLADMVRFAGKDAEPIADTIMESGSLEEAADTMRDYLLSLEPAGTARSRTLTDIAAKVVSKALRGQQLMDRGYAPLTRFGTHVVDVMDKGERVYFGLFESRWEARAMAAKMRAQFPEGTITRGTTSQEAYKLFAGITPETAELFGEMLGLEADGSGAGNDAFQKFLKEARSSRSAMKRLIERKGIAGFSEDVGRVLAGFVYSNARQTASGLHAKAITQAANDIPQGQGELKDMAVRLTKYVTEPRDEAVALRGLLFAQYLGGNIASMLVNMTQPFAVTAPYLTQFDSVGKVAGYMKGAVADAWKKDAAWSKEDPALGRALREAAERGDVAPQEVHQLMRQAAGRASLSTHDGTAAGRARAMANNLLSRATHLWGQPFAVAELFNRRVTFIAAYRLAVARGIANPAGFAVKAINDTQFVYNKGNKPQWARGAVGALLFTFKQYSVSYLELVHRMYTQGGPEGKKAAVMMLAMLMLAGGAGGLPFEDDISDLIDGIGQRLGYNLRTKHARQQWLEDTFGKAVGGFMDKGVTGLPGMPFDLAGRFGMGNLIPGTGLLTQKPDHTQDVLELAGPAGEFAKRAFQGANKAVQGDVVDGALTMAPTSIRNLQKAYDMATLGYYPDASGKKVIETDAGDVLSKAIGFQPSAVSDVQEATQDVTQLKNVAQMKKSEISDKLAMAVFKKDADATQSARNELLQWNLDNPESPIRIQQSQIMRRVREMNKTKAQRLESTTPREIRATVARELRQGGAE